MHILIPEADRILLIYGGILPMSVEYAKKNAKLVQEELTLKELMCSRTFSPPDYVPEFSPVWQ